MKTLFKILIINLVLSISTNGQFNFEKHQLEIEGERISGLHYADFDNDGDNDIIACYKQKNKIVIWINNGNLVQSFTKIIVDSNFIAPLYVYAKDINNDSLPDFAISSGTNNCVALYINLGENAKSWQKYVISNNFENAHMVLIEDIDNDGNKDLIVSCGGTVNRIDWWKNNCGTPLSWHQNTVTKDFSFSQTIAAGDINGDGKIDIVAGSSGLHQVAWFKNEGGDSLTFTKNLITKNTELPHWVTICDINMDGFLDVISCGYSSAEISLWKNSGEDSVKWTRVFVDNNSSSPLTVVTADLNNDGLIDIIANSFSGDKLNIYKNINQTGDNWEKINLVQNYNGPWPLCTFDIDNDGDTDIVSASDVLGGSGLSAPLCVWENRLIVNEIKNNDIKKYEFNLNQNFPNPFNSSTTIGYYLKKPAYTEIYLYTVLGELIKVYDLGIKDAGYNELTIDLNNLAGGVYFYKLNIKTGNNEPNFNKVLKMTYLK